MSRSLLIFLCLLWGMNSLAKMLVRVYGELPKVRGLDIVSIKPGQWIDIIMKPEELSLISTTKFDILLDDVEAFERKMKGEYHDYNDFVDSLIQISTNHPAIAQLDTIGISYENRPILGLKISDNVTHDEDEPELFFMGLHHAREWPTLEICLFYADTLTRAYDWDDHITEIVDSREIWIVPCLNPDGYIYCHDQGNDWRKNRRYFPEYGTYGVDLNRNYDGSCDGDPWGAWGSVSKASVTHNPGSEVYCGPEPFSEIETQAVRNFILSHNFTFTVSYHTWGEMVLWPWGYTYDQAPDVTMLSQVATQMAQKISRQGTGTYDAFQSASLYPTTGDTDDWSYGYLLYCAGENVIPFTVEACNEFQPPQSSLDQIVRENFDGALYLCEIADSIRTLFIPRIMPPEIEPLDSSLTGDYEINWSNMEASKYTLQEFTGLSITEDGAESKNDLWIFDAFIRSTVRAHSGTYSYHSVDFDDTVMSMTSIFPIPTTDSLIFWCWYYIEDPGDPWDFAFVEISNTGREWQILDFFTGSSGDWIRKAYKLPDWGSVYIRFRYTTDTYYTREGFYVDDIYPAASFSSVATLSNNITDTFYTAIDNAPGTYWYQVKGYNSQGWGDFCELEDMTVKGLHDVGVDAIITPQDTVFTDSLCVPTALVKNYGDSLETLKVICQIDTIADKDVIYKDSVEIILPPGIDSQVNFTEWQVLPEPDIYYMRVSTKLATDMDSTNDYKERMITSVQEGISELPENNQFYFHCAPNPSHSIIKINYGIAMPSGVCLKVYDVAGRSMLTLVNKMQLPGSYVVSWNTSTLPAGIYFIHFKTNIFQEKVKITLLK